VFNGSRGRRRTTVGFSARLSLAALSSRFRHFLQYHVRIAHYARR
jgi:hypothetical protein